MLSIIERVKSLFNYIDSNPFKNTLKKVTPWTKVNRYNECLFIEDRDFSLYTAVMGTLFTVYISIFFIKVILDTIFNISSILEFFLLVVLIPLFLTSPYLALGYWFNKEYIELGKSYRLSYQKPFPVSKIKRYSWSGDTVTSISVKRTIFGGMGFPVTYTPYLLHSSSKATSLGISFSNKEKAYQIKKELEQFFNL